jgi:hypothetical protein
VVTRRDLKIGQGQRIVQGRLQENVRITYLSVPGYTLYVKRTIAAGLPSTVVADSGKSGDRIGVVFDGPIFGHSRHGALGRPGGDCGGEPPEPRRRPIRSLVS